MKEIEHNISLRIVKILNLIVMVLPFALSWYIIVIVQLHRIMQKAIG